MAATDPPPALAQAIGQAAQKYGIDPHYLVGIWRIETGSSYPNPYENGLGYGGEFGTRMSASWGPTSSVRRITEPPLQQQADTAASILANLIKTRGSLDSAFRAYSGSGYSSVNGTVSNDSIFGGTGGSSAGTSSGSLTGSTGSDLDTGKLISGLLNGTIDKNKLAAAGYTATGDTFGQIGKDISSVPKFLSFVSSWRFAEVVGGALLLLVGLVLLGRQFGVRLPTPGPFGSAASSVDETFQFQPGEATHYRSQRTSREGTGRRRTRTVAGAGTAGDRPAVVRADGGGYDQGDVPF